MTASPWPSGTDPRSSSLLPRLGDDLFDPPQLFIGKIPARAVEQRRHDAGRRAIEECRDEVIERASPRAVAIDGRHVNVPLPFAFVPQQALPFKDAQRG